MEPFRPFWYDEALKQEGEPEAVPLQEDISADVCIIGGGYTGLWTALDLKERKPELDIVIIEKNLCGYGASGCNGGCVLTLATKYSSLKKFYGRDEAKRLVLASEDAVGKLKQFTEEHGIECDLRIDGALYIATNDAQVGAMDPVMQELDTEGINSWEKQDIEEARDFAGTDDMREAFFSGQAGSVQPALLVRGMARVAREKGIRIYEGTPMSKLIESQPPEVKTPNGSIKAAKVVLAINAWMATEYKQFQNSIAVVSSDMAITEPVPEVIEKLKLNHGATICDSRIFVHYFHTTSDGRLMLGKGGNTFAYGSKMIPSFFQASEYEGQVKNAIGRFYPELKDVKIAQSWNGGSDRSKTGFPFFGNLNEHPNIHYGFGYSGNGVTQAYLGGKILASLCLDADDEWSRCGFVGGPRGQFPPEPVRWLGAMMVRNAIRRKEAAEDAGKQPSRFDTFMARFAKGAGKADK
ncbi:MAG: FAD-dependent oxidoreductase [Akkermansiaceae bacterium]